MFRHHKIFVWLWAAALLTATVGVSVHQVYCYCLGQTSIEWLGQATHDCPEPETATAACCAARPEKAVAQSCCKTDAADADQGDCKERSVKVFQLKTEFLVEKTTLKVFDFQDFVLAQSLDFQFHLPTPEVALNRLNKAPPAPHPPQRAHPLRPPLGVSLLVKN